jgi:hypothetical protein
MFAFVLFAVAAILATVSALLDTGRDDVLYGLALALIAAGLAVQAY